MFKHSNEIWTIWYIFYFLLQNIYIRKRENIRYIYTYKKEREYKIYKKEREYKIYKKERENIKYIIL